MKKSEVEEDLVPVFATQLRGNIEIERSRLRRKHLPTELAAGAHFAGGPRGEDAERSFPGDDFHCEDRTRQISRMIRPATKVESVSARREPQRGARTVDQPSRPIGMPDRHAIDLLGRNRTQ